MRAAAFKFGCGLVSAAGGADNVAGLGRAAADPGSYTFNTTAEVEEVDDEGAPPSRDWNITVAAFQRQKLQRRKVSHADEELRDAVDTLHKRFEKVKARGHTDPVVIKAVRDFLPTTDALSLLLVVEEADALVDSIPMRIQEHDAFARAAARGAFACGVFDPETNQISINPKIKDDKTKLTRTVMHELLHATGHRDLYDDIAAKDDAYGRGQCLQLAKKQPNETMDNCDNWYFAILNATL